ncbi:MAG: hypothetical protein KAJ11_00005, partial [Alphaproteobacteria bacterium]|nr:hypothetical protein [Alphaproteobacteria bacterium]
FSSSDHTAKIKNPPNLVREGLETRCYRSYAFDDHIVMGLPKMRAGSLSRWPFGLGLLSCAIVLRSRSIGRFPLEFPSTSNFRPVAGLGLYARGDSAVKQGQYFCLCLDVAKTRILLLARIIVLKRKLSYRC